MQAPESSTVSAEFLGVKKQLYFDGGGGWIGLSPVSYRTPPGNYPLKIRIASEKDSEALIRRITVTRREFPKQHLAIPEKKRQEIFTPANQEHDARQSKQIRDRFTLKPLPPLWEGRFVQPVSGRITSGFGLIRYINNLENGRHSGLDISAPTGTPVAAVNQGIVAFADTDRFDSHYLPRARCLYRLWAPFQNQGL